MKKMHLSSPPRLWLLLLLIAGSLFSCSKSKNNSTAEAPTNDTMYNRLITVSNFTGDTSSLTAPDASRATILFSLDRNTGVPILYAQTNRWDVSFSSIFNSFLGGNNGANSSNAGSGGPGQGGIAIIAQYFDSVNVLPSNLSYNTAGAAVGTDDAGLFGQGVGWYVYDWSGTLYYTSPICHQLGIGGTDTTGGTQQHTAWARPDRTIIVHTPAGEYARIKMISIYKDADPNPVTGTAAPYLTFQYVLGKPGSTDLSIH